MSSVTVAVSKQNAASQIFYLRNIHLICEITIVYFFHIEILYFFFIYPKIRFYCVVDICAFSHIRKGGLG